MAVTEPPLPRPVLSNLLKARDIVVEQVQAWMGGWASHPTIGHSGVVTQEFIDKQAGMAPRSIVTVVEGRSSRAGHHMQIQCMVTFVWYVLIRGRLIDRTDDALNFISEAQRFIYADVFRDADTDKVFSRPPEADSVQFKSLYRDKDENTGYTIWAVSWQQEVALGSSGRPRPGDGLLLLIQGTTEIPGDPGDTVEFEVT